MVDHIEDEDDEDFFGDSPLADDDYIGGDESDDEDEELGVDYHTDSLHQEALATEDTPNKEVSSRPRKKQRWIRVRAMPAKFKRKFPDASTILITRMNGSQVLLVRGR